MRRVVLEKVCEAVERHQVVRRHHLDVTPVHRCLGEQHPDPAETVYAYSYGHSFLPSVGCYKLIFARNAKRLTQAS
jgi:hypothetical protein